jgi:acetyl esterase/lipase
VAGGAPCDFEWLEEDSRRVQHFLGGTRRQKPEVYRQASPIYAVSADDPPVFLFHGQYDRLVPLSSPTGLLERLKAKRVRAEMYLTPEKGHFETFFDVEARRQAIQFLNDVLKNDVSKPDR